MKRIDFNSDWYCKHLNSSDDKVAVTLPHDAMINEPRSQDNNSGVNCCWIAGYDYEYTKTFTLPAEYADKNVFLEFEGVYHNAEVYLNGEKVCYRPYGYTNFYVTLNEFAVFGGENEIKVIAKNADQPNSRWYSGAGIYRPVTLYVADRQGIALNGVKIRTLQISPAIVEVLVKTTASGKVAVEVVKDGNVVATESEETEADNLASFAIEVPDAKLWTPDTPELYTFNVKFLNDEESFGFGIRQAKCTHEDGFTLNGERVILRGACIHSDNGILGARSYKEAEERKVQILKKSGYNAIRSAHNPCSKSLLDACDKYGMMVMDEYVDMWYVHKTMYDYATYSEEWYERDITDMVEKDYNHPSVILYSLGNEVAETGEKRGIEFYKKMQDVCHTLDPDRTVTAGVNIFFNYLYSLGFGQYSDEKAKKNPEKKVGSEFFNNLAGIFGDKFMKTMAKLPGCDRKTRECYGAMDVAGYNYGIKRYKGDLKKYTERIILGSETFCSDAYKFYELAKANNALIGDFVWAGIDYLGEVGVGAWEYKEYAPDFLHGVGWMTAGSGRVDLIGNELGEALYTKVAFELTDTPQIAVVPVNHTGEKHSPSAWKFSNAIPSWSWNGLDGKDAKVEVYSRAPMIELFINGKKVGSKKFGNNCRFDFNVKYYGGEITAVAKDGDGNEISRNFLKTAKDETVLTVLPEKSEVSRGEVCFVKLRFTDTDGVVKPLEHREITVNVTGGEVLALGNACPFNPRGYMDTVTDTYYGEALLVVRATGDGVKVSATDGTMQGGAIINVIQ